MKLIVVPHSANRFSARIWLCATDTDAAPADFAIDVEGAGQVGVPQQGWRPVTVNGSLEPAERRSFVQLVEAAGLQPGTRYRAAAQGVQVRFSTLPQALPREGERPFNVLLASCFSIGSDRGLDIGKAVNALPEHSRPDLKILCGDQVYLDFPAFILGVPFSEHGLARSFLGKYLRNWGDTGGYQALLASGSSYFTSDDHEFWNNYPNAATIISNTWTAGGRRALHDAAFPLFSDFQCERAESAGKNRTFQVGPVSFFLAETRAFREAGDGRFLRAGEFSELLDWIAGLQGPGVLTVGQPLFEEPPNWFRKRFADRTLSNYEQYQPLVRALLRSKHSVLILTGDVHYARIASAALPGTPGNPEIAEVIASPLALVAGSARMPPDAPAKFPPQTISGAPPVAVKTIQDVKRAGDNFAILQFTEVPGRVKVRIRHWYVREAAGQQAGPEATLTLL